MNATYAAHDSPSPSPYCLREPNSCLNSPAVGLVTEMVRCHTQYGDTREEHRPSRAGSEGQCVVSKCYSGHHAI